MEIPDAELARARQRLTELRQILLTLHKALLDSERTSYEIVHGPIASPGAFLQLLIHDNSFQWLRPITTLIVQIDEKLAAKKPLATTREMEQLMVDIAGAAFAVARGAGFLEALFYRCAARSGRGACCTIRWKKRSI